MSEGQARPGGDAPKDPGSRDSAEGQERQRRLLDRMASRRRDRLAEEFRRTQASPWPTWAYAVALALMVGAVAALLILAANYD